MKIAILVYGRLKNCGKHYTNTIQSLGEHNIDFFVSSDNSSESDLSDFIRLYKPILYDNSSIHYENDLSKYGNPPVKVNHMIRHFINKNRVLALLTEYINKTSTHYHCVVSLRIDCVYEDKFDFSSLEENTIYIPNGFDWVVNGLNDQIAYGKLDVMDKYNSISPVDLLEKKAFHRTSRIFELC